MNSVSAKTSFRVYLQIILTAVFSLLASVGYSQNDPDIPDFARYKINKEEFMKLRAEAIGRLRGFDPNQPFDVSKRMEAVQQMEYQRRQGAARPNGNTAALAGGAWVPIGPMPIPNGQTQTISTPVSGRTISIAVHPTNPNIVYVGTAQGGLYRTTDGGVNWVPIMDNAQSLAIGSIAISPSNPEIVYVGTGEANFSADSYFGVGVYRIDDASTIATLNGPFNLDAGSNDIFSGRAIGKVIVHPTNPDIIFVASASGIGGIRSANSVFPSRGIYRCNNATSASPVFNKLTGLIGNLNVSVRDIAIDPDNPNILIAVPIATGTNQGGIYRSTNALNTNPTTVTFSQQLIINSTSTSTLAGELAVIHPSGDANATFYAAMGISNGRVYRSTDGGVTWTTRITNGFCGGQCFYDIAIAVDPSNVNTIYLGGDPTIVAAKSTNGGTSFTDNKVGLHVDSHVITVSPSDPTQVWLGTDGGIYKSTNSGLTWAVLNNSQFSATQFMGLDVHPTDPNFSIGGTQDNGTNFYKPDGTWTRADFGDGGWAVIDQNAADNVNVRMYHTYFNASNLQGYGTVSSTVSAVDNGWAFRGCQVSGATTNGITCNGTVNFYAPLERGPGNPNTIYYGSDRLYRSANNGTNHTVVSQNPIVSGVPISSIGISPQNDNVRIVGLNDGGLWGTSTGSSTLVNLDASNAVPNLGIGRTVIDPNSQTTAYVTISAFGVPSVYKTTNLNNANPTWMTVSTGLPMIPVNAIVIDPANSNNVYVGTDIGVYVSTDAGANWEPFGTGLPVVAVFGIAKTAGGMIRIATHGRGMWQTPAISPSVVTADLAITKTDNVSAYTPGSSTTYTIVVSNNGPDDVTGATVTDNFPASITSANWTVVYAGGASGPANGSGNINASVNIPVGGTATFTVVCNISASATGTLSNTASVAVPSGVTDPTPGNNSATDSDTPNPVADLSITKTDGATTYTAGGTTTYTLVVSNSGPSNVTGATVTDNFPASIASANWTVVYAGGASGPASGSGNISASVNIPVGGTATFTAVCNISASATGTLSNTATVAVPSGVTDPTPGSNSATDSDTPNPIANLSITKTDGSTTYTAGGSTTYTLVASNSGPSNVTGATVTDNFPASITSANWTVVYAGGASGPASGSGNISSSVNIPVGGTATFTAVCNISASATGTLSNTASVAVPSGVTDPTPGNNSATDSDTPNPVAELSITKTDGATTYTAGGSTTYTLVVSNSGPSNVTGATVTDNFPASITSANWTVVYAGGASGPASGSGNISASVNIPVGGTATFTAVCNISASATGTLSNTATVAVPSGVTDPTPGNNSATDSDEPQGQPCGNDNQAPVITEKANPVVYLDANGQATVQVSDVVDNVTDNCDPNPNVSISQLNVSCLNIGGASSSLHQAYVANTSTGNQAWRGELGMEFKVNAAGGIIIKQLGAFDHQGNGITGTQSGGVRVAVFNKNTLAIVPGLDAIIVGNADGLANGHRMKNITPVTLGAGDYVLVSKGYNSGELNGNGTYPTGDDGSGAISYMGTGRYGTTNVNTFEYPANVDGGSPNQYLAGTFVYETPISNDVTITASDVSGNMAQKVVTVTVMDNTPPVIIPKNITVYLGANGQVSIQGSDVVQSVTDNCVGVATLGVSPSVFDCNAVEAAPSGEGSHLAYIANTSVGNQAWGGELGMPFTVNNPDGIVIDQLGAFDHQANGITGTQSGGIRVAIFNNNTQAIVPGLDAIVVGNADGLISNHRMKNIVPVTLPPGEYLIVTKGYNVAELNGNGSSFPSGDDASGAISFIGFSRYGTDNVNTFAYPANPDVSNPHQYLAGTFHYSLPVTGGGGQLVTISATDSHGNVGYANAYVTVVDIIPPVVTTKNITVQLNSSGQATIVPGDVVQSVTDNTSNCHSVMLQASPLTFNCSDLPQGPGSGSHQAYVANTSSGNQNWGGELGMEFRVNASSGIVVKQLGAFDHQGNGILGNQSGGIRVAIFNKNTQAIVPGLDVIIIGNADGLVSNHRMKNVTPVVLPPGDYVVVSKGYNSGELNGNGVFPQGDNGGGLISYIGTGRYGTPDINVFAYPANVDGGTANQYLAGTFTYEQSVSSIVTVTATDFWNNVTYATANVTIEDPNNYCSPPPKADFVDNKALVESGRDNEVRIYPNPTSNQFDVRLVDLDVPAVTIQVFDLHGKVVAQKAVSLTGKTATLSVRFNLARQSPGMYIVKVISRNGVHTEKVLLQR